MQNRTGTSFGPHRLFYLPETWIQTHRDHSVGCGYQEGGIWDTGIRPMLFNLYKHPVKEASLLTFYRWENKHSARSSSCPRPLDRGWWILNLHLSGGRAYILSLLRRARIGVAGTLKVVAKLSLYHTSLCIGEATAEFVCVLVGFVDGVASPQFPSVLNDIHLCLFKSILIWKQQKYPVQWNI